jgi:hypothetical protein
MTTRLEIIKTIYEEFINETRQYLDIVFDDIETLNVPELYQKLKSNFTTNKSDSKNYFNFKLILKSKNISFDDKAIKHKVFNIFMDKVVRILTI